MSTVFWTGLDIVIILIGTPSFIESLYNRLYITATCWGMAILIAGVVLMGYHL